MLCCTPPDNASPNCPVIRAGYEHILPNHIFNLDYRTAARFIIQPRNFRSREPCSLHSRTKPHLQHVCGLRIDTALTIPLNVFFRVFRAVYQFIVQNFFFAWVTMIKIQHVALILTAMCKAMARKFSIRADVGLALEYSEKNFPSRNSFHTIRSNLFNGSVNHREEARKL